MAAVRDQKENGGQLKLEINQMPEEPTWLKGWIKKQ